MKLLWLGRGTLTLRWGGEKHTDNVRVYFPGEIIEEAAHLAELGETKIAELVKDGSATENLKLAGRFRPDDPGYISPEEKQQARAVANEVATSAANMTSLVDAAKRNGEAVGKPVQILPVPVLNLPSATRSSGY